MSVDLHLYCKKTPSKHATEKVIIPLGFQEQEPLARGHHWYYWFEERALASTRGCYLSWRRGGHPSDWPGSGRETKTVFTATTYAARSYEDVEMQNRVIRELRKTFGGSVYDPQDGRRAFLENDLPRLKYAEKRCGFVFLNMQEALWRLGALPTDPPESEARSGGSLEEHGLTDIPRAIVLNNLILPYLVSSLESFLRRFFIAFVDSHPELSERVFERQGKLEYAELRPLLEGKISLAEHEAANYSFQSLESANAAFERYVGINLFRVWGKRRKFAGRFFLVRDVLQQLLDLRHRIVHEAYIAPELGKEATLHYIRFAEFGVQMLADELERSRSFRIDLEKHL